MLYGGIGLGFRRDISKDILSCQPETLDFVELAPENWMETGGVYGRMLTELQEKFPIVCHGLSLSIGSPEPLDWEFIKRLKAFFKKVPVELYSEHLSYSQCDNAHLHELLPIPFRQDAIKHIAGRIRETQEYLERKIALENVSYYTPVAPEMGEAEFLTAVLEEGDCDLLLDVNNVYVNAFNHGYDPREFLSSIPLERVAYIHIAGHKKVSESLIIDTHGAPIIDPVYQLLEWVLPRLNPVPILLERDFNFPSFEEITGELNILRSIAQKYWGTHASV